MGIKRLQEQLKNGTDLAAAQKLFEKLQQRVTIKKQLPKAKRRRLPSVGMALKSGNVLKIQETLLSTQIKRLQEQLKNGTDLAAAQKLFEKLQQRVTITKQLPKAKRRRLPSVGMALKSGNVLKIQETLLSTQIKR